MLVKQVPEDFSGHDEDLGIGLKLDIACHNPDSVSWKLFLEIRELLIRQGLDGIGGEDSLAFCKGLVDGDLSDSSLA